MLYLVENIIFDTIPIHHDKRNLRGFGFIGYFLELVFINIIFYISEWIR
ncbi:hypothetical protein LCGC14_0066690 [marine sediment metagenome]|uniref:Uncharacterized protein n=1 Tax=marine sediment metagenome TaxID=412755 RepID=A0A0F9VQB2_9ZZZZ